MPAAIKGQDRHGFLPCVFSRVLVAVCKWHFFSWTEFESSDPWRQDRIKFFSFNYINVGATEPWSQFEITVRTKEVGPYQLQAPIVKLYRASILLKLLAHKTSAKYRFPVFPSSILCRGGFHRSVQASSDVFQHNRSWWDTALEEVGSPKKYHA